MTNSSIIRANRIGLRKKPNFLIATLTLVLTTIGVPIAMADSNPRQSAENDATLPKVTVEADAETAGNPEDDPYNNLDPHNKDYAAAYKSNTTKTNTPLMDSPFSLQVVPREAMNDQRSPTIGEIHVALRLLSNNHNFGTKS